MSENEAFITEASEQFGNRGARQAQQILEQAAAMFAGGSLTDEDKIALWMRFRAFIWIQKTCKEIYTEKISEKPRGKNNRRRDYCTPNLLPYSYKDISALLFFTF